MAATTGGPVMSALLVALLVGPVVIAVAAFAVGRRRPRLAGRLGAGTAALGFLGAAVLAVGAGASVTIGADDHPMLVVAGDRLAAVLLLLVYGVSAIVQTFAIRYLAEDDRVRWFSAGAGLLTGASATLMTAGTLVVLGVGWTASGVALCLLLATYWRLPSARDGVRRTAVAFLIGDLALWSAVALIAASQGTVDLRARQTEPLGGPIVALAACLVVVAALSRSAQIPFHRWLPATLAAPTPVSALLHAGVVNAGGVLLIKLSSLVTAAGLAQALTIVAGIATLAFGAVVMLVKPDVKGALAHSTMAQMGFMILTCGLGLWAAAVFHLVAHGFYKATLFLSSGSAIAYRRRNRALPPAAPRTRGAIAALLLPAGAIVLALTVVPMSPGDHTAEWALLIFAWVTGAAATRGWRARRPGAGGVLAAACLPAAGESGLCLAGRHHQRIPGAEPARPGPAHHSDMADRRRHAGPPRRTGRGGPHCGCQPAPARPVRPRAERRSHRTPAAVPAHPTDRSTFMTIAYAESAVAERRSRLRSDITLAARVVPTHYPLETFIAVNPLAGFEALPFEQAVRRAADLYCTRGTLSESAFRDLYRAGRITDTDLDKALARRYPNLLAGPGLRFGDRDVTPADLLRGDLLHGTGTPQPLRRYRSHAERIAPEVAGMVDAQAAKWCAAFFGAAAWPMPGRGAGFYAAWRALATADPSLPRRFRAKLRSVPERPDDAILEALSSLGVEESARAAYLQAHLTRLPGWAAHIQWCASRGTGIDLPGYLAMRLSYEAALLPTNPAPQEAGPPSPRTPSARQRTAHLAQVWGVGEVTEAGMAAAARILAALPVTAREMLWQNAFEGHYRDGLLSALSSADPSPETRLPHTQLVACIDTRSEGLRRHLESLDGYQTFGFAGFFAVAIRFTDLLGGASCDLCPVLIEPSHDIRETPAPDAEQAAARRLAGVHGLAGAESAFHAAKDALAAPFTLAEAAGWAAAPLAAAKTLTPAASGKLRHRLCDLVAPYAPTELSVVDLPLDQRVLFAQVALTTDGTHRRVRPAGGPVRARQYHREQPLPGLAGLRSLRRAGRWSQRAHRRGDPQPGRGARGVANAGHRHPRGDVFPCRPARHRHRPGLAAGHPSDPGHPPRPGRGAGSRPGPRRCGSGCRTLRTAARRAAGDVRTAGRAACDEQVAGLGPGVPGMGTGRQRRLRDRATGGIPRNRPAAQGLPALLRGRRRPATAAHWKPSSPRRWWSRSGSTASTTSPRSHLRCSEPAPRRFTTSSAPSV